MHLKKLTIEGFKSFGEKITLNLNNGLTVIVGPNGAGKSNILDSIKWVFGARSLKDLRIDEIKNVLFHGVNKNAHFAEVNAVLGDDGEFAEETTITRRLYEDGTFEYYLNGEQVRLKDIKEFIAKNACAFTNYSLFEQNNVDAILKISPRERAKFFEEIAGLSYYRLKFEETSKTLQNINDKFQPLQKRINELQKEKTSLEKEVKETKMYLETLDILKTLKKKIIVLNFQKIQKDLERYTTIMEETEKQMINLYSKLINSNITINGLKEKIRDIKKSLYEVDKEITHILNIKDSIYTDLNIKQNEYQNFQQEYNKLLASQNILQNELKDIQEKIPALNNQKTQIEMNIMSVEQYINNLSDILTNLLENKKNTDDNLRKIEEKLFQTNWEYTNINNDIVKLEEDLQLEHTNLNAITEKITNINNIKTTNVQKTTLLQKEIDNIKTILENEKNEFKSLEFEKKRLDENKIKNQTTLQFLYSEDEKLKNERQNIISLIESEEKGIKQYIQTLQQSGLECSLLFDIIELKGNVSQDILKYIGIFENSILCKKLEENITSLEPPVNVFFILPSEINESQKNELMNFLANNAIVCKNKNFLNNLYMMFSYYLKKNNGFFTFNDVLYVKLGSCPPPKTNLHYSLTKLNDRSLQLQNQINELKTSLENYETKIMELDLNISTKRTKIYELNIELEARTNELNLIQKEQQLLGNEIEYLNTTYNLIKDRIANIISNKQNALEQKENLQKLICNIKTEQTQKIQLLDAITSEYDNMYIQIEELKKTKNDDHNKLTNILYNLTEYNQKMQAIKEQLHNISILTAKKQEKSKEFEEEIKQLNNAIEENNKIYQHAVEYKEKLMEIEKNISSEYETAMLETTRVKKIYDDMKSEIAQLTIKLGTSRDKLDELKKLCTEEFNEEYVHIQDNIGEITENESNLKQEIKFYEEKAGSFKNINMNAIDKLSSLESELTSLESEYNKLYAIHTELTTFLTNLEKEASMIFEDTVSNVSESFNKFIRKLFEGGKAQVKLAKINGDYEILLNVQIPNKNVRLIESFSGGERTLVSLALLFAFLELKPSPFYVLDEIDASLDDNNLTKLLGLLKEFSYNHQIIMISHNKHTLNIADNIIGVTIGEGSFTRVLGINLSQALSYAN